MAELDLGAAAAEFRTRIEACGRFWITVHETPDGDAIGAALALGRILERLGKRVAVIRQPPFPTQYERLPRAAVRLGLRPAEPHRLYAQEEELDLVPPDVIAGMEQSPAIPPVVVDSTQMPGYSFLLIS